MNKDLLQKIGAGLAIAITIYAIYLRGQNDATASKVGSINNSFVTLTLDALHDFEISDREIFVPAYRDSIQNALAVNSELYKGSFAAANKTFTYPAGMYDLTLMTLKERGGESSYKILVDQKTWAFFKNDTTSEDYTLQKHKVKGVYIAEGEVVQVQFNSHSNNKIPEEENFAYSRGRWQSLTIEAVERK